MPDIRHRVGIIAPQPHAIEAPASTVIETVGLVPDAHAACSCVPGPDDWIDAHLTFDLRPSNGETVVLFAHGGRNAPDLERSTRCGKANCRCHAEPPDLHRAYLRWSYTHQNRRFIRWLTPQQEERFRPRIEAARHLRELVSDLEGLEILSVERAEGWRR